MSKTLAQMVTEVRDHLDEQTPTFWTDVQIRKWINEAVRDVSRRAEVLLTTTDVTVTAATQSYVAPTDVVRINRAEWHPSGQTTIYPLEYKDYNGMDSVWWSSQAITQGYPIYFTLWGFPPSLSLVLYPTPSDSGTVKLFYYRLATELATDGSEDPSNVDVPEGWYDLVIYYAEANALRKDGDQRWQEARQIYEQSLQELMDNSRRWSDQAGSMEFSNQLIPAWLYGGDF